MSIAVEPEATRLTATIGDKEISFETGAVAKQAHGAVLVRQEGTVVLATAVGRTEGREGADFFPLTVDVEEKMYAAGKIPGGFFKREGRAGEKAILTARMVDRPIRPLWPKGYKNEVQIIVTTFSADQVHPHDILAINGSSAALMLSPMPFLGPVGAVRIGRIEGTLAVNPTLPDLKESTLDLIVCGTPEAITMVEAGAQEVSEEDLIEALEMAHAEIKKLCQLQIELAAKAGLPKWADGAVTESLRGKHAAALQSAISAGGLGALPGAAEAVLAAETPAISGASTESDVLHRQRVQFAVAQLASEARDAAVYPAVKSQFGDAVKALTDAEQDSKELKSAKRHALIEQIADSIDLPFPARGDAGEGGGPLDPAARAAVVAATDRLYKETVRTKIAVEKRRPDGRSESEIRLDHLLGQRHAAHARLGALHPRPDAGAHALHARHGEGGAADRRPLPRRDQALHPPLQLPALQRRRDRLHARPQAARHRPRSARRARARARDPVRRRLPVHAQARLRDPRVERVVVDGVGVRLDALADGRRRADHRSGGRHRDGAHQGGRLLHRS